MAGPVNASDPPSLPPACKRSTFTDDELISSLPPSVEPPFFSSEVLGGGNGPYLKKGEQLRSIFTDPKIDSQPPYGAAPTFKVLGSWPQHYRSLNGTKSRSTFTDFKFKTALSSSVTPSFRVLSFAHSRGKGIDGTPRSMFTDHKLKSQLPSGVEPSFKVLGIRDPRSNTDPISKNRGLESVFSLIPTMNRPIS
jgi:hypothetical protein